MRQEDQSAPSSRLGREQATPRLSSSSRENPVHAVSYAGLIHQGNLRNHGRWDTSNG